MISGLLQECENRRAAVWEERTVQTDGLGTFAVPSRSACGLKAAGSMVVHMHFDMQQRD